jgi:DNA-binding CsgD family transcriptional regulator
MPPIPGTIIIDLSGKLLHFNFGAVSQWPQLRASFENGEPLPKLPDEILALFQKTRDRLQENNQEDLGEMHQAFFNGPSGLVRLRSFALGSVKPGRGGTHVMIMIEPVSRKENLEKIAGRFQLSRREVEVVQCLLQGLTNPAIAAALYISPQTVKTHVKHIMRKMGVSTRNQIVMTVMNR